MKKTFAVFSARNKEFTRDRHSLVWNFVFPFLIIIGFAFIFSGKDKDLYKIGVVGTIDSTAFNTRYIKIISYDSPDEAVVKVARHQLDLLFDAKQNKYWINTTSPKGYVVERLLNLQASGMVTKETVTGREIRYVDWVFPGVLGMNVMFSCLFGVGFVIVRYRKNGVLKRLSATPLSAFEFLSAQIISRFMLALSVAVLVYIGCKFFIHFKMEGSYISLLIVTALGILCMISLGVLSSARTASEEFAGGLINLATWPMMFLSGVWFSLEGSPKIIIKLSQMLPLTHLIEAARGIMNEGKTLADVSGHVIVLAVMTLVFLFAGSLIFRWNQE